MILAPHVPFSQQPSQKPHRPVTADQTTFAVSTHFFSCPLTPFLGIGFLVVFTKYVKRPVSHSLSEIHPANPPVPQDILRARDGTFLRFSLEWPLTQSTIVLLSPLISSISFLSFVGISITSGAKSPGFFDGTLPPFSVFFPLLVSSTRAD